MIEKAWKRLPPSAREAARSAGGRDDKRTHPRQTFRRGRCPRSGAKRNKYPWGASPRCHGSAVAYASLVQREVATRSIDGGIVRIDFLCCHSEPVTDVTGVGIRPLILSKSHHTPPEPPKPPTLFKIYQNSFNLHTRFFKIFPCLFKVFSKKFHFFPTKSLTTHR